MVTAVEFGFPKLRQNHQEKMAALLTKLETERLAESALQRPSLRPGTIFADRFIVGRCLYGPSPEKMTQSEIYVAQDKEQGYSFVALKVSPLPSLYCISALDDPFAPGFNNETKILFRSLHPAFPRFVTAGCVSDWKISARDSSAGIAYHGPRHYIAMERLVGIELDALIKIGLPFWQTLDIMMQLLNCTATEHDAGFVDRDLKPQNVIIQPDGLVRRYDFALARKINEALSPRRFEGTELYASPEQLRREAIGQNADIYALGLIFFEMLTGRHPMSEGTDGSPRAVSFNQLNRPLPTLTRDDIAGLSTGQKNSKHFAIGLAKTNEILAHMTAKDPRCRYQTIKDALRDLKNETLAQLCQRISWFSGLRRSLDSLFSSSWQ